MTLADDEVVGFQAGPTTEQSGELTRLGRELLERTTRAAELAKELEEIKSRVRTIQQEELPAVMRAVGQNVIGLAEGVQITLRPFYHANIAADWPEEKRQAAFDYLEARGDGDLIKLNVSYAFRRGQLNDAVWLKTTVDALAASLNATLSEFGVAVEEGGVSIPDPTVRTEVHYATLTAYVREQLEAGREIDLDVLGAQVGEIAEIKTQNEPKATRKRK
jgi:hypothetical protein